MTKYSVFQIKAERTRDCGFLGLTLFRTVTQQPGVITMKGVYDLVYEGTVEATEHADILNDLYVKFNMEHPADYRGRSMSVGDIVRLDNEYYYCNSFGWSNIKVQLAPSAKVVPKSMQAGYVTSNPTMLVCGYDRGYVEFQLITGAPIEKRKLRETEDGRKYFVYRNEEIFIIR